MISSTAIYHVLHILGYIVNISARGAVLLESFFLSLLVNMTFHLVWPIFWRLSKGKVKRSIQNLYTLYVLWFYIMVLQRTQKLGNLCTFKVFHPKLMQSQQNLFVCLRHCSLLTSVSCIYHLNEWKQKGGNSFHWNYTDMKKLVLDENTLNTELLSARGQSIIVVCTCMR